MKDRPLPYWMMVAQWQLKRTCWTCPICGAKPFAKEKRL